MKIKLYIITVALLSSFITGRGQANSPGPSSIPSPEDYQLIFQDEFEGSALDWNVWGSADRISTSASGEVVGRWKENAVLAGGLLKLMNYKGNRADSEWTAASVWVKEKFGRNTYYEARFKVTDATGVNNAFWTSVVGSENLSYKNRYEIDVVEAKKLNAGGITCHLAWHDWKTYSYTGGVDIAQGISKTYSSTGFQTWGLWVGEDHIIIYHEGTELWRGTTHPTYTNQWNTGVGKLPQWHPDEEKRAYGKWGQDDWSYTGGMNGDDMNIVFSTMPWGNSNSTLTDNAHNSHMDVDWLRIYKRKSDLNKTPEQVSETVQLNQPAAILNPIALNTNQNRYFSFVVERPSNNDLTVDLNANHQTEISLKITKDNELQLSDGVNTASTATAYPASTEVKTYFESGRKYLIVGRITASTTAKDIVSIRSFELGKALPEKEPVFYWNIDDTGNTSITNEWHINKKIDSNKTLNVFVFSDESGQAQFGKLMLGNTWASVTATYADAPKAYLYGQTKSTTERRLYFDIEGKFPFSVIYTDGKQNFTVDNITTSPHTFLVYPGAVSQYTIVSAADADGVQATVGGNANFYVDDARFFTIRPSFDTYLTEGTTDNPHTAADLFTTSKTGAARESFLVYDFPEGLEKTGRANAVFYVTSKSATANVKIELLGNAEKVDANTIWNTAPAQWEMLDSKVLGNLSACYIDFDITAFCNALLEGNNAFFTLKLRQSQGDENMLIRYKPGHNTTTLVPSFLVLDKTGGNGIENVPAAQRPVLCYDAPSRRLFSCAGAEFSSISLYDIAGQLILRNATLPYSLSERYAGLLIAQIDAPERIYRQKLIIY
ncbi:hypothetical protein FACS189413_12910 [Bacteroidia bacterium]|nr:hypothetical protein FACS189413_12910 [Bacteroidia bacterium]